jgi:hypothetical protein
MASFEGDRHSKNWKAEKLISLLLILYSKIRIQNAEKIKYLIGNIKKNN